jgi:hypothetical protein
MIWSPVGGKPTCSGHNSSMQRIGKCQLVHPTVPHPHKRFAKAKEPKPLIEVISFSSFVVCCAV